MASEEHTSSDLYRSESAWSDISSGGLLLELISVFLLMYTIRMLHTACDGVVRFHRARSKSSSRHSYRSRVDNQPKTRARLKGQDPLVAGTVGCHNTRTSAKRSIFDLVTNAKVETVSKTFASKHTKAASDLRTDRSFVSQSFASRSSSSGGATSSFAARDDPASLTPRLCAEAKFRMPISSGVHFYVRVVGKQR